MTEQRSRAASRRICFVSPSAYPLLDASYGGGWSGGAEAQFVTIGRELVASGHDVHFIVGDFGQNDTECIDGITIHRSPLRYMGGSKRHLPRDWLRFVWTLFRIRADVHFIKVPRHLLILMAWHCRLFGGKLVFVGQKDTDVDEQVIRRQEGNLGWRLYRKALAMCHGVVAQTETQRAGFRRLFGKESTVIRNVLTLDADESPDKQDYVLWVGNSTADKQGHLVPQIAERLPDTPFRMIMSGSAGRYDSEIRQKAEELDNFDYIGQVPFTEIAQYYKGARLFISTSRCEGFPNTFLQAWQFRTPVITLTVDPDGVTQRHALGRVSGTMERLVEDISEVYPDDALCREYGENAFEYVQRYHSLEAVMQGYVQLLDGMSFDE